MPLIQPLKPQIDTPIFMPREEDFINIQAFLLKDDKFTEDEIKGYIENFLSQSQSAKFLGYEDKESLYQRISLIPNLKNLIQHPVLLMITLHVLPYLEEFYKHQNTDIPTEVMQKDLYHIYTILLIDDMADVVRLKHKGLIHIGRFSISESIFQYSCGVAKIMNSSADLLEIKEEQVKVSDNSMLKRFFSPEYNPTIFKNEENYYLLNLSREHCIFLIKLGEPGKNSYTFIHQGFLDYFATLSPQSINSRRKEIQEFMKVNPLIIDTDLKPGWVIGADKKLETSYSALSNLSIFTNPNQTLTRQSELPFIQFN